MKKTVLAAFGALFAMAGLHSCLDFDMPTDTFTGGDTELDPIVYKGKADSIDYRKEIFSYIYSLFTTKNQFSNSHQPNGLPAY